MGTFTLYPFSSTSTLARVPPHDRATFRAKQSSHSRMLIMQHYVSFKRRVCICMQVDVPVLSLGCAEN